MKTSGRLIFVKSPLRNRYRSSGVDLRVCFLCIGYEPGRDGVGDYVRGLIDRLPAGVTACVIALTDPFAPDFVVQQAAGKEPGEVRIPSHLSRQERYRRAVTTLRAFDPDVVSLQFVTWAFGPKGVILDEAYRLRTLIADRCLHIMFHEPWVRPSRRGGPLHVFHGLLGQAQRASIMRMTAILHPAICHTSNQEYQALFRDAGIKAEILPIFGNIVPTTGEGWDAVRALAQAAGLEDPGARRLYLVAGLFGAIRNRWDALPLLRRLATLAQVDGRRLLLVSLGHNTPLGAEMLRDWTKALPQVVGLPLGGQPADMISQAIASCDIGLAHQPGPALGRSTTTAAFLEHGVPVVVAMGGALAGNDPFVQRWRMLLIENGPSLENEIRQTRRAPGCASDLRGEVTAQFVADLERGCAAS